MLLISGDRDAIVEKANGPYVLEHVGSSDKRLLALPDSSHEVTLDYTGNGSRSKSTTSSGRARELTLAR